MWCVPELNAEYVERMEDVLALYERRYDPSQPVVCLDERPAVLHADKRPRSPAIPGREARFDYEYARQGTANIFCAVEPLAGRHITKVTRTRDHAEFAKMVGQIVRRYPSAKTIHLVMDNLSTHSRTSLERHYGQTEAARLWDRLTVHFTPKHGSWLNMAEIEIGLLNRECMGRRRFETQERLQAEVRAWNRATNRKRVKIRWGFTRDKARKKFGYTPTDFSRSEH